MRNFTFGLGLAWFVISIFEPDPQATFDFGIAILCFGVSELARIRAALEH